RERERAGGRRQNPLAHARGSPGGFPLAFFFTLAIRSCALATHLRRSASSASLTRRALPLGSLSSFTGPIATRLSRITLCPSLASIRRISRFLPSVSTTRSQVLFPCGLSRRTFLAFTRPSLSQTPS